MKRILKKITAFILVTVLIFGIIPSLKFDAKAATTFSPRLSEPGYSGYYEPQSSLNPFKVNTSVGNGNCVWYAWGRAYEILGARPNLLTNGNADVWWSNNISHGGYSYGQTAKLGAIACWYNSKGGHVAVVEKINNDGTIVISQSGWSYEYYFNTKTIKSDGTYSDAGTFQGFIYLGNFYTYTSKPINPWITASSTMVTVGETVTFNFDATYAETFSYNEWRNEELKTEFIGSSKQYTTSYSEPGTYIIHAATYNDYGLTDTPDIVITVYDSKPENTWITASSTMVTVGENVTFEFGATNAETYSYNEWRNEELTTIFVGDNTQYTTSYSEPGTYIIHAATYNDYGLTDTPDIVVTVYEPLTNYTLTYNPNGGSNPPATQTGAVSYTISSTKPTRSGYTFLGWSNSSSATTASYKAGDTITLTENTTLYAVWQKNVVIDPPVEETTTKLVETTKPSTTQPVEETTTKLTEVITTKPAITEPTTKLVEVSTTKPIVSSTEPSITKPTEPTTKPTEPVTKPTTKPVVTVPTPVVEIRKPSQTQIKYGDSIILHADVEGELSKGAKIVWESNNSNFSLSPSADGRTCTISPFANGDSTITAKIVEVNGNEISKDTQSMTSKAGFFDKIIAFFKKLFGLTKTIPQVFKDII